MAVVDRVRRAAGMNSSAFNDDVNGTMEAARLAMIESGVPEAVARSEENELVIQALKCYARANEAWEEPVIAQGQMAAFQSIANTLSMTYGGKSK